MLILLKIFKKMNVVFPLKKDQSLRSFLETYCKMKVKMLGLTARLLSSWMPVSAYYYVTSVK